MKLMKNSDQEAEELAALLDELFLSGSHHINLEIGDETRIQTINSTECAGKPGACAIPNANIDDEEE